MSWSMRMPYGGSFYVLNLNGFEVCVCGAPRKRELRLLALNEETCSIPHKNVSGES